MSSSKPEPIITALKLRPNNKFYAKLGHITTFKIEQQVAEENYYLVLRQLRAQGIPANVVWVNNSPYIVAFEDSLSPRDFYLIYYDRKGKPYLHRVWIEFRRIDIKPQRILQGNMSRLSFLFLQELNLYKKIFLKKIQIAEFGSKIEIRRSAVLSLTPLHSKNSLVLHGNLEDKIFVNVSLGNYISEIQANSDSNNSDLDVYLYDLLSRNVAYRPRTNCFPFTMRLVPTGEIYWELSDIEKNGKMAELE